MDSNRKNASTKKRCLICRGSNKLSKLLSPKSLSTTRSFAEQKIMDLKENWGKSCIDSVCRILGISKSHPFKHFFSDACYCQDCIQLLRDIDFTLISAKALQQQIIGFREDLFAKLGDNFGAVEDKEYLAVSYKEIESPTTRSKTTFQYDEVIKMMYEKFNVMQNDWTSVDFLDHKELNILNSRIKKENVVNERIRIKTEISYQDKSAIDESIRLCRTKKQINYFEDGLQTDELSQSEGLVKETTDSEGEGFDQEIDPEWNMSDSELLEAANNDNDSNDDEDYNEESITSDDQPGLRKRNNFYCSDESCLKGFNKEEALRIHERKVHEDDPTPYHCQECDEKYSSSRRLAGHVKKHNINRSNPVDCPECGKSFKQSTLNSHMRKVHKLKVCSFCEKEFENEEELLEHENTHKNSDQPFKCVTCDATFTNTTNLKQHMRTHSNNTQICDVCGKRFRTPATLRNHRKSHDESHQLHRCLECGRICRSKNFLERHMIVHSTEKKFICDVCGAVFKWEKGLKLHYRNHTGDFRFECKVCGKRFIGSHHLKNHEEIHSGILAYECKICQKKFRTKNNLRQHEKTHEPKDPNKKPRIRHNGKTDAITESVNVRNNTNRLISVANARNNISKKRFSKRSTSGVEISGDSKSNLLNSHNQTFKTASSIYFKRQGFPGISYSSSTEILPSQSTAASHLTQPQQQCYYDDLITIPSSTHTYINFQS